MGGAPCPAHSFIPPARPWQRPGAVPPRPHDSLGSATHAPGAGFTLTPGTDRVDSHGAPALDGGGPVGGLLGGELPAGGSHPRDRKEYPAWSLLREVEPSPEACPAPCRKPCGKTLIPALAAHQVVASDPLHASYEQFFATGSQAGLPAEPESPFPAGCPL